MDDRLQLIQHLYGEKTEDPAFSRRLIEDESLRREYEQLRETKKRLDGCRSRTPESEVVDRVVEEARSAAERPEPVPGSAPDRSPRAPDRRWSRRLQGASAALALMLVIGIGWWQRPTTEGPGTDSSPVQAEGAIQQVAPMSQDQERPMEADAVPAWDDREDLVRIHRGIERVQARSGSDAWGGLQTVGQTRP